jgi:Mg2+ and Co2+ transporter CorA
LNIADNRARRWLEQLPDLPDDAKETILDPDYHDRIDLAGSVIAGVFIDLRLDFEAETEEMAQLRFILADRLLITARRQALRSIEATRVAIDAGRTADSALDLFETIVDRESDLLHAAATDLAQEVDRVEDRVLIEDIGDTPKRLGAARRRAVGLHRQVSRLLALFRRVEHAPSHRLPAAFREGAGRIAQRLESIHQEIGSALDRSRLLQDEVSAKIASATNRQLYVLSMLTAVFLPATLVTGLFGMNVKGIPFGDGEVGFWPAAMVAAAAALAVYAALRQIGRSRP